MNRLQTTILQLFETSRKGDLISIDDIIKHCHRHGVRCADKTIRNNLAMMKGAGLIDYSVEMMVKIIK